jgi:hypothetical protein
MPFRGSGTQFACLRKNRYQLAFERSLMNGVWSSESKMALLSAPSPNGWTARSAASQFGRTDAARLFDEMLERLRTDGRLTQEEFEKLQRS